MDDNVTCVECGGERFQIVGYVMTIQEVKLTHVTGTPFLADREEWPSDSLGFEDVLEDHEEYFIECARCCTKVDVVNYDERLTPKEALGRIQSVLSGEEWDSDSLELVGVFMEDAGFSLAEPEEDPE